MHTRLTQGASSLTAVGVAVAMAVALSASVAGRQGATPSQAQPTFRAGTTVVEVDVIVRDKAGRFVNDLVAGDFEVQDDGKHVEIVALYRVVGPGDAAVGGSAAEPSVLPVPPPQQVQRALVFLFDQNHIQPGGFDRARKAAIEFLAKNFRQGDVGGVVSGGAMVNGRLTSSREELEAALGSIKPPAAVNLTRELRDWPRFVDVVEALRVTRREPGTSPGPTVLDDVVERACRERPDECRGGGRGAVESQCDSKATDIVNQGRLAGKQVLDTISALSNGLARLPGRKTLVLMTDGFFVEDSWADLRAVVGRAARASVRIYALDTRGLNRGSASSDIFTGSNPSQPELSAPSLGDTNSDGPNSLAVDTGGYVIRNENDFGKAFSEIDRDTSSYYVVGFRTNDRPDGKFHGISVRVNRSGVSVRARKGYVASAETTPVAAPATAGAAPAAAGAVAGAFPPAAGVPTAAPVPPPGPPTADAAAGTATAGGGTDLERVALRPQPRVDERVSELTSIGSRKALGASDSVARQARAGWDAYRKGDLRSAREALGQAAASGAAPPWVHYALGWALYADSQYVEAGRSWEQVRSRVPEFEPVYFDLVDSYMQQREYGKAVSLLREAETRWPKDVEVVNALGVVLLSRGAVDESVATFERAVAVNPTDAGARYNLGKTYEVRAMRADRLGKVGPGAVSPQSVVDDRQRAMDCYRQVIVLGGPLVEAAKEGLKRLGQ